MQEEAASSRCARIVPALCLYISTAESKICKISSVLPTQLYVCLDRANVFRTRCVDDTNCARNTIDNYYDTINPVQCSVQCVLGNRMFEDTALW